jgi:Zn-dependent protease
MRKIYYSFNEMPFENSYSYENQQTFKFGRKELQHIFISLLVLTVAFAFALAPNPPFAFLSYVVSNIPLAFIAIFTAFFCHEIAHKYMGQKYGYWSEFRMFPMGLLIALFLGVFIGIVFAAPGAVQIFGRPTKDETGKISVAGPLVNILISSVFLFIWFISSGIVAQVSFFIAYINAFLAMFNLIPFGPLDGWKIFSWKKEIWGLLLIASISTILFLSIA